MKLTCVTAVFNAIESGNRENLIRCVRSIAALKTPHEHLIYDGGSTDGTVELLRELEKKIGQESRLTRDGDSTISHVSLLTVHSEKDTGIYNAINKGVRDARGEWFYVLGCDDFVFAPEVLDKLLADAVDAEVVCTDVYEDSTCSGRILPIRGDLTLWSTPYCHQGVLMRTETIRTNRGFDENYRIVADYKLMLQCHLSGRRIQSRPGADVMFACHGMNGTSEINFDIARCEYDRVLSELLHLDIDGMPVFRKRRYLPLCCFWKFLFSFDAGLRTSARAMMRQLVRQCLRLALYPLVVVTRPIRYPSCSLGNRPVASATHKSCGKII